MGHTVLVRMPGMTVPSPSPALVLGTPDLSPVRSSRR
jgi:hypothetical protein